MTREEAKQAIENGHKVTHELFTQDEWIGKHTDDELTDETGCILNEREFWACREDSSFDYGWSKYEG